MTANSKELSMMIQIKTEAEQARLDAIFAEIEAAGYNPDGSVKEAGKPDARTQEQISEDNRRAKIDRLASLERKEFLSNVKANIGNNAFKTKWEKILSQFIVNQLGPMNTEMTLLRNFANAVGNNLEHCAKLAKEQDNHHHYKVFADRVRGLLENL